MLESVDRVREIATIRNRHRSGLSRADLVSALVLGWGFVVTAIVIALVFGGWPTFDAIHAWALVGLIALYALSHDTVFAAATGSAVPTQPVFVAMLLTVPLHLVPLALLLGVLIGASLSRRPGGRTYLLAVDSLGAWHCIGPVAVLAIADLTTISLAHWPVYLAALAAQFAVDAAVAAIRCIALGSSLRSLVRPMAWTFSVDTMLAPIGLTAVIAAGANPQLLVLLAAPLGLIRLLASDRSAHLEEALTLGTAFAEASTQARLDSMTGVTNRRGWEEAVFNADEAMIAGGARGFTVVVGDLDHLKRTNDEYGHQAGDDLIRAAAGFMTSAAPPNAVVARLGGDEFGMLVEFGADGDHGEEILASIRASLAAQDGATAVSMSLGTWACPPSLTVSGAAAIADQASAEDKIARRVGRSSERTAPTS